MKKLVVIEYDGGYDGQEIVDNLQRLINGGAINLLRDSGVTVRGMDRIEGRAALLSTFGDGPGERQRRYTKNRLTVQEKVMTATQAVSPATANTEADDGYPAFRDLVAGRIREDTGGPLFTTAVDGEALWEAFLHALPEEHRQHYNCRCCKRFVETYGGLVAIDDKGQQSPVLWAFVDVPQFFVPAVNRMLASTLSAKVNGIFLSSAKVWGTVSNIDGKGRAWTHLSGFPSCSHTGTLLETPHQCSARLKEDHGVLLRSLAEYPKAAAVQAVRVLEADVVDRPEKSLEMARWFLALYDCGKGRVRDNLLWRAVAQAPAGWCHVKTSVLSTLLDDVVAGREFEDIKRRWAEKMHPLQYRRPTAAPSDGQIQAAEQAVEKLGIAASLNRRYATLADVTVKLWESSSVEVKPVGTSDGVFGHLRKPGKDAVKPVDLPPAKTTWKKFLADVLPGTARLELRVPSASGAFYGLLTAADPTAPPILQWDAAEVRNPVSWFYQHGYTATQASAWSLTAGAWADVTSVFPLPAHWADVNHPNPCRIVSSRYPETAHLALAGCVPKGDSGSGLFPEILKAELHGVRAVIEAHSNRTQPAGREEGTANGLSLVRTGKDWGYRLRATGRDGAVREYMLERWE